MNTQTFKYKQLNMYGKNKFLKSQIEFMNKYKKYKKYIKRVYIHSHLPNNLLIYNGLYQNQNYIQNITLQETLPHICLEIQHLLT